MPKRKLENGEQRLAPQSHQSRAESPEFAGQRLGRASITRGNVGSSHTAGNRIGETALAGWACRIRTGKCHFEGRLLNARDRFDIEGDWLEGGNAMRGETKASGASRRMYRSPGPSRLANLSPNRSNMQWKVC